MATKDHCLSHKLSIDFGETPNDQYRNLNLNHNYQSLHHADIVQSKSAIHDNRKNENYESEERYEFNKSKSVNNSTLSLHIAEYENSAEVEAETNDGKTEGTKREGAKTASIKKWVASKEVFTASSYFTENPFEFPRQQEDRGNDPEVMQFKASQRLRNPNKEDVSGNKRASAVDPSLEQPNEATSVDGETLQKFSCAVCFEEFFATKAIFCGSDAESDRHSFCQQCVVSHAKAAAEEMPLAEGGIGLKCMEFGCKKAILYSSVVQELIPKNIRKRIDERIVEENLAKSGLILERNCNFSIEMDESKEENKLFACPNCKENWCRLCERRWDDEHFGISCAQLDKKKNISKKQRELECKLNEAVIRKCSCGLQFTKADGCNKICGLKQCYVCRAKNIDYDHFCQHERNPGFLQCPCGKKCTLWVDTNQIDQNNINHIRDVAAKKGIVLDGSINEKTPAKEVETQNVIQRQREVHQRQFEPLPNARQLNVRQRQREAQQNYLQRQLEAQQRQREAQHNILQRQLEAQQRQREAQQNILQRQFEAQQRQRKAL
uniref:RING-type domain-containing protein n=1 Tax=Panagrolaimus sp. ES5 TaxID=591445 RepID=A0AC34GWE8_9BILA